MVTPFTAAALERANHERAIYRAMACAALDELHAAQREIERQRIQIAEMRDEQKRYARSVFGDIAPSVE